MNPNYHDAYASNELEKYNDYLNYKTYSATNAELTDLKRGWREAREVMRKQALDRAAEERSKVLMGFFAHTPENELIHGSVRARHADEVREYLVAKRLNPIAVAQLLKGESIENIMPSTLQLREQYEKVREEAARTRSLSDAEAYAQQWLKTRLREQDEAQAIAEVDTSKGYTSKFSEQAERSLIKSRKPKASAGPIATQAGFAFVIGFAGDLTANIFLHVPEFGLASIGLAASTLLIHGVAKVNRIKTEPSRKLELDSNFYVERSSLQRWLHVRYGLSVQPDVLAKLAETMHGSGNQVSFAADDGRYFKFMKVADAEGWFVFETAPPVSEGRVQLSAAITRAHEVLDRARPLVAAIKSQQAFTGEVALLHERIQEMLSLLNQQPLTIEEQHVVNRARQDVAATQSTLSSLAALGDREAGQKKAAGVFGQLVEELNELVAEKKAALLNELDVQRTYVTERRRPAGGRLELIKPQAQLEAAKEEADR